MMTSFISFLKWNSRRTRTILAGVLLWLNFIPETHAQNESASVRIDDAIQYQTITGLGGFVCAPTFNYDYMTTSEIEQLWGENSEMGYKIMRLYIPIGRDNWCQSLATALSPWI